jgi:hypothetical protein
MVLSQDRDKGRVALSTRKLERTKGDMLRDPQKARAAPGAAIMLHVAVSPPGTKSCIKQRASW